MGTPENMLKQYEQALLDQKDWTQVQDGLEVKTCASPEGQETFILCRSQARREKEKAMHERFDAVFVQSIPVDSKGTRHVSH